MEDCKKVATPIATNCLMDVDEAAQPVDSTKYRGLIGSLLYLTASRPDIQFGVCLCARFQANPKESDVDLWYPCEYLKGFESTSKEQPMLVYGIHVSLT